MPPPFSYFLTHFITDVHYNTIPRYSLTSHPSPALGKKETVHIVEIQECLKNMEPVVLLPDFAHYYFLCSITAIMDVAWVNVRIAC